MSKSEIKVSVMGKTCTGKSTVLWLITKTLMEHGVEVEIDFNDSDYKSIEHLKSSMEHDFVSFGERVRVVREKSKVILDEKNRI